MTHIYAGFLSYAHADEAVAARFHRAIETYKIPKGYSGTLSPIFRDATELTAHHSLSEKIQGAVTGSRVLIVLCSPAAKASHWVNEEIRLFRKIHGEASILCVLAEGTPDTSFPPALLAGGREPLAANLGSSKESFRLGVTQIAAAMLGVGLDKLIQRDTHRKRRRLQTITAGALIFSTAMGITTFSAVMAQKTAEANRIQAEGLVEYMITDMKAKLEPVKRLDILNGVGVRAVEYYDSQITKDLPDDSLTRQARARHIIGEAALDSGDFDRARHVIRTARDISKDVYIRNPEDADAIFTHAQSEYWTGVVYFYEEQYSEVLPHWIKYAELGQKLYDMDSANFDWVSERVWGTNNIGLLNVKLGNHDAAKKSYEESIEFTNEALRIFPNNVKMRSHSAEVLSGLARIAYLSGDKVSASKYWREQAKTYKTLSEQDPADMNIRYQYAQSLSRLAIVSRNEMQSQDFSQAINFCLEEYEFLIAYDRENETWKNEYSNFLKHLYANISDFQNMGLEKIDIDNRLKKLRAK